jgi:putative transposase
VRQAQRFLSAHAFIYGHFRPRRHRTTARNYGVARTLAFKIWTEETCAKNAAQPRRGPRLQPKQDHGRLS